MSAYPDLVDRFCTPPRAPITEVDRRIADSAERFTVRYGGHDIAGCRWGEGPCVLFVHGWGSAATHFGGFLKPMRRAGLSMIAFDGPAHRGSSQPRTNLVDFCRATRAVADTVGPLHAIVGFSFGAAVAGFVAADAPLAEAPRVDVARLALISPAISLRRMTDHFATSNGLPAHAAAQLRDELEATFDLGVGAFDLAAVAERLRMPVLVLHDEDDTEVPVDEARRFCRDHRAMRFKPTRGNGHMGMLISMPVIRDVVAFLSEESG